MLIDTYGRVATDLRVSLTDRCNLRCTYCMPEEGLQWLAKPDLLTDDEIVRLVRIAVTDLGVTDVRFTGGEPLLRPGLVGIVERCAALDPRPRMSLTTNGIGLRRTADGPARRGPGPGQRLARHPAPRGLPHPDPPGPARTTCSRGLAAARAAGLTPVKVNTVLMRGVNDDEAPDLLALGLEHGYELRFIEQMPLDAQHGWQRDGMVTAEEILAALRTRFDAHPRGRDRPRLGARRALAGGRRPGPGRRDRLGHPPVLPGLRPHPADRRRPGAQLPVRPRGVRPARRRCAPAPPTRRSPGSGGGDVGQEGGLGPGRPGVPPAGPPDVSDRRLTAAASRRGGVRAVRARQLPLGPAGTTSLRKPRTPRNCDRCSRCSSQASQVLRRSGVCSFGLFQASTHTAAVRQPLAEQIGVVVVHGAPSNTRSPPTARPRGHGDAGQPRGEPPGVGPSLRRGMRSAYEVCHALTRSREWNVMIDLSFS